MNGSDRIQVQHNSLRANVKMPELSWSSGLQHHASAHVYIACDQPGLHRRTTVRSNIHFLFPVMDQRLHCQHSSNKFPNYSFCKLTSRFWHRGIVVYTSARSSISREGVREIEQADSVEFTTATVQPDHCNLHPFVLLAPSTRSCLSLHCTISRI